MEDHSFRPALELSADIASGTLTAESLMRSTLARIAAVNDQVNAIISLRPADDLLREARAADQSPRSGWLHGIPIAIKELAQAKGLPATSGSPVFAGQVASQDDLFVARIRAAGAVIIGKTNAPEFGLGSHTYNPVFGTTRNPYDLSRSAGGSSGGAAVAVWHLGLYAGIIPERVQPCTATGPSCTDDNQLVLGIPIPLMALVAFASIGVLSALSLKEKNS